MLPHCNTVNTMPRSVCYMNMYLYIEQRRIIRTTLLHRLTDFDYNNCEWNRNENNPIMTILNGTKGVENDKSQIL